MAGIHPTGVGSAVPVSSESVGPRASFKQAFETEGLPAVQRQVTEPFKVSCPSKPAAKAVSGHAPVQGAPGLTAAVLDQVSAAQDRLESVLALARSGKSFTPAELIALQAQVYRVSQELDFAGKVVEKSTAGVKQVLQTQV